MNNELKNLIDRLDNLTEETYSGWKGNAISYVKKHAPVREQALRDILDNSKEMHEVIAPARDFLQRLG